MLKPERDQSDLPWLGPSGCDKGMFDLKTYLKEKQQAVNRSLDKVWEDQMRFPGPLIEAMRYSVESGGKRLRPVLAMAASEAVGGSEREVMPAACALELIHTYSLIHDDLPAMDNDDLRRGKATCHKAFDEATAILAGDALLTLAFEILAHAGRLEPDKALTWLEVAVLIAGAAGCSGMVEGQMLDILSEKKKLTLEELETLQGLKTGALIEASVRAGALLGGGSVAQIASLGTYGRRIGLAFQMADDILNVEGSADILGKPVGSDEALHKATGPSVMGLEQTRARMEGLVEGAVEALDGFAERGAPLLAIARYVVERKR
ncbi:MAG: farnesyl diphosphate synthase [Thermodesulfobacteriota bacterium]|nr:farnesyl diphosphate synthase [Thermodesulfobacteriota bacterium]